MRTLSHPSMSAYLQKHMIHTFRGNLSCQNAKSINVTTEILFPDLVVSTVVSQVLLSRFRIVEHL